MAARPEALNHLIQKTTSVYVKGGQKSKNLNLGLVVEVIYQPFNPEGGAYGETRTSGHKH